MGEGNPIAAFHPMGFLAVAGCVALAAAMSKVLTDKND